MDDREKWLREKAVFLYVGQWPNVMLDAKVEGSILKDGAKVMLVILPIEKTDAEKQLEGLR